jgi:hypothetical protein
MGCSALPDTSAQSERTANFLVSGLQEYKPSMLVEARRIEEIQLNGDALPRRICEIPSAQLCYN